MSDRPVFSKSAAPNSSYQVDDVAIPKPVSDLRAAVEALRRILDDAESQHPGGWGPDVTTVGDLREALAIIDAHQYYDVDALAEALRHIGHEVRGATWSWGWHSATKNGDPAERFAAAIIARLHEA